MLPSLPGRDRSCEAAAAVVGCAVSGPVSGSRVYAVHAVCPDEICATEVIWTAESDAEKWAHALSTDPGVLAAAVTWFALDSPGERRAVALFVQGKRQQVPHLSDDRRIGANGYVQHRSLRRPNGG